jgi:predicted XRE-type DNA-binding protein
MANTIEKSCGNVFADLGVDDPDDMQAKAQLALAILNLIEERGLTQIEAAQILGTDQSYISRLKRGRELRKFTFDRLMNWLIKLDHNITLTVKQKSQNQENGYIQVAVYDTVH